MGKIWPKQADKRASIPDANLLSASQNVRKVIQKMTKIKITKWWINITSKNWSSFKSSPPQRFTQIGGRSWLFSSKNKAIDVTLRNVCEIRLIHHLLFLIYTKFTVITTGTFRFNVLHGKQIVRWKLCLCWRNNYFPLPINWNG